MSLENTLQASGGILRRKHFLSLRWWFDADNLLKSPKKLQNLHRHWRWELLWIDHWLELWQGICRHFHANSNPQVPQTFSPPCPKTDMTYIPQMDSDRIWPNYSVCERNRQHPASWLKGYQIYRNQGWLMIVLLARILSNHVTCFKWDIWDPSQTNYYQKSCYWYADWLYPHVP